MTTTSYGLPVVVAHDTPPLSTYYTPPQRPRDARQALCALWFAVLGFYSSDAGRGLSLSPTLVTMLVRIQELARSSDATKQKHGLSAALDFLSLDTSAIAPGSAVSEAIAQGRAVLALLIDADVEAALQQSRAAWREGGRRDA